MLFSQWTIKHVGIFFIGLNKLTNDYQYIFQALTSLGVIGIPITWWRWKKEERENITRNLSSISITEITSDGIAYIKNTSSIDGSDLCVKIYKPKELEIEGKYKENDSDKISTKQEELSENIENEDWEKEHCLNLQMSIGEVSFFHIKHTNLEGEKYKYIHFAPIKIEVKHSHLKNFKMEKYLLFRLIPNNFSNDDFHPHDKWVIIFSKNKK